MFDSTTAAHPPTHSHLHRRSLSTSPKFPASPLVSGAAAPANSVPTASSSSSAVPNVFQIITISSPPQPQYTPLPPAQPSGQVRINIPSSYGTASPRPGAWRNLLATTDTHAGSSAPAWMSSGSRRSGQRRAIWILLGVAALLALIVLVRSGGEDEESMAGGGIVGGKWEAEVNPEMDVRFAEVPKAVEEVRKMAVMEEVEELVVTAAPVVDAYAYEAEARREVQSVRVADEDPSWRA